MGDLRPELAERVETHVAQNAEPQRFRGWCKSAFVAGVINVAQTDCARRPEPFRKIEHAIAIIVVSHDDVLDRVEETLLAAGVGQAVVARVLIKNRGIGKIFEEHEGGLIGKAGAKPFGVSGSALAEGPVIIVRLTDSGVETGVKKYDRIK